MLNSERLGIIMTEESGCGGIDSESRLELKAKSFNKELFFCRRVDGNWVIRKRMKIKR